MFQFHKELVTIHRPHIFDVRKPQEFCFQDIFSSTSMNLCTAFGATALLCSMYWFEEMHISHLKETSNKCLNKTSTEPGH
jgi:hypothetical protein